MRKLHESPILFCLLRICVFATMLAGIWYLMLLDSLSDRSDEKFGEKSYTEYLQQTFLFLSSIIFLVVAQHDRKVRGFAIAACGFCLMLLVREFNNFFHTIFIGAWQVLVALIAGATAYFVYQNNETFLKPARKFLRTPAFGFVLSGMLIVMIFSRLYGLHYLWYNLMGETFTDSHRWVKNASEEGIELLGYTIFFFGTVEYLVQRNKKWLTLSAEKISQP
ncbi:MAG: hypothetical protein JNJ65_15095 [Cyclobacteriaceae bacterium]|nr:hypothetical protein [Cyclobacteriaceae bacterium]